MWTLWIVSTLIDSVEPKYTRYAEYESKLSCEIAWYEVTSEFTEDEVAFCNYE
jgi:hypothetical protein